MQTFTPTNTHLSGCGVVGDVSSSCVAFVSSSRVAFALEMIDFLWYNFDILCFYGVLMIEFTICLADQRIGICCEYERTRNYCADYLTGEPADFYIHCCQEDLEAEQEHDRRTALLEHLPYSPKSPTLLELSAVYRKIADHMIDHDTLLFHGSVVSVDGQGYLFTALSGTGKSTHTGLWRQVFGERAVMVNDDKPLLKFTQNGVLACGTPWNGKHRLGSNIQVPLKGLCILSRGQENQICPMDAREALPFLLQQCYRPTDPTAMVKVLTLLDRLTKETGLYSLACNMDPEAAEVAYRGMNRKDDTL